MHICFRKTVLVFQKQWVIKEAYEAYHTGDIVSYCMYETMSPRMSVQTKLRVTLLFFLVNLTLTAVYVEAPCLIRRRHTSKRPLYDLLEPSRLLKYFMNFTGIYTEVLKS